MINKHFPSANKEWTNSVYNYNKNNLANTLTKNNLADVIIKGHFYLNKITRRPRSKRMRVLIFRRKTRKIFVSKPYIKQTNEKNIFTVFVYNRQKLFSNRKLFFLQKKFSFYKLWLLNHFYNKIKLFKVKNKYLGNEINIHHTKIRHLKSKLLKKHRTMILKNKGKRIIKRKNHIKKIKFLYTGIKLKHELDFFKHRLKKVAARYYNVKNIILYKFLLRLISMVYTNKFVVLEKINSRLLITIKNKNRKINFADLVMLNKSLLYYVKKNIINNRILNTEEIKLIYVRFKHKYLKRLLGKLNRRHMRAAQRIAHFQLNDLKFTKLLHNLKISLGKLYNKSANINIISLKYPFLDANIYTQLIINKARKKLSFLKVLSRSIKLAKLPSLIDPLEKKAFSNYSNLKSYKKMSLKRYKTKAKDYFNNIMLNIFPRNLINKELKNKNTNYILNKTSAILNTVKFKWISGVKIEGTGRLTRRFIAARSLHKYKYLGNLRNKQYKDDKRDFKTMPTVLLRNTDKSNLQYNFNKSKRRIGAFGIKNWISAY